MKKTQRPAFTYRGARRNLWRKTKQHWDTLTIGDKGWRHFAQLFMDRQLAVARAKVKAHG